MPAMGPGPAPRGASLLFPFHCWSITQQCRIINFNVNNGPHMGPGPGVAHSRFTVGRCFIRRGLSTFCQLWGNQAAITVVYGPATHHPFHCWTFLRAETSDHFSEQKPGNIKNAEKTLGWPTIIDGIVKMAGFDISGF